MHFKAIAEMYLSVLHRCACFKDSGVTNPRGSNVRLSFGSLARRQLPRKEVLCQATRQKKKASKAKNKSEIPRAKEGKGFAGGTKQDRGPAAAENSIVSLAASEAADGKSKPSPTQPKPLPKVSRSRIFWVCVQTSSGIAGVALLLRQFGAVPASNFLGTYTPTTEALLTGVQFGEASHWAIAVGAAAAVTAARQALIRVWPAYRDSSDRSNRQMMAPLQWYDLLWVGGLPGLSEELLFRGALLPAIAADWRGVAIAGLTFGSLHFTGGRNWAFAVFASAVGMVYGAAFLATENVVVPISAHVLSNIVAAAVYKQFRQT